MEIKFKRAKKIKVTEDKQATQLPTAKRQGDKSLDNLLTNPTKSILTVRWLDLPAIVLAYVCLSGGARLSTLGMDWGYYTIEHFIGQASADAQGYGAFYLTMLAAPAIYGSMIISILKARFGGHWRWRLFLLPAILAYWLIPAGLPPSWSDYLGILPYLLSAWLAAGCLSIGFDHLYRELMQRTNAKGLLNSLLIAILPAAFLPISSNGLANSHNIVQEIVLYCGLLFAAGFWVPISIRASKQSAAFAAQIFTFLPVNIFNLVNLLFAIVCLIVGKYFGLGLSWQAPVSALLILVVTSLATTLGAAAGCLITPRLRFKDSLL